MRPWFAPAHFAVSAVLLIWNIVLAGRIARVRNSPPPIIILTALGGLLLAPALLVAVATTSALTGRAILSIAWLWPAVLVMFAAQAIYALVRRLVSPLLAVPIALYDVLLALAAIGRYAISLGGAPVDALLALDAAHASALAIGASPVALWSPFYVNVPLFAPAFPALRRATAPFRIVLAVIAAGWSLLILLELPLGIFAADSYARFAGERLQERPGGDFVVGVKLFPDLGGAPPSVAVRNDVALADTLDVDVVEVALAPSAVTYQALDSIAHTLDNMRRDSTALIVSLIYPGDPVPGLRTRPLDVRARLHAIDRIARRLHPDILLPADAPYGSGRRAVGRLPVQVWRDYFVAAAHAAHRIDRRIRIGIAASTYDVRDSTLYAWAAAPGSPVDVLGFELFPSRTGARGIDAAMRAADRWMRATPSTKDQWVFAADGFPLAHGLESQSDALWGALAWATSRPRIKGFVVAESGDYGTTLGLRAPSGDLRPATFAVMRAINGLHENAPEQPAGAAAAPPP